jgi:ubiquinone/menaquinone biosynthesis C-methylase UbiE
MSVYATDHHASVLRTHSWRTAQNSLAYLLPSIKHTMKILDVGCGPGTITLDVAKLVPKGHITGVDYTEAPLAAARTAASGEKLTNVDFQVGDVHALPFAAETFDIVYAHQVLQHVRDPVQALREMKRVAKRGGLVGVRESASMTWYPQRTLLTQWKELHMQVSKGNGGNPDPGSWIHVWAREAGFGSEDIRCSAGTWCFSTKEEREWWSAVWGERLTASGFADKAVNGGYCTHEDLEKFAAAWRIWGKDDDGWFCVLHGEIICHV